VKIGGGAAKSGLKSGLKVGAISPASVAKSLYGKKAVVEEEDAPMEADGEVDETRYVGCVKPAKGIGKKFSIECDEVKSAHNRDAFVTIKSKAPPTLKCEDWISFNVVKDKSGLFAKDIEIEVVADAVEEAVEEPEEAVEEEPEEAVEEEEAAEDEAEEEAEAEDEAEAEAEAEEEAEAEDEDAEAEEANEEEEAEEDEDETEEKPKAISRSSAVALFRKSQATGKTFNAGFKDGKKNGVISTAGTFGKPAPNLGAKPKVGKTPFQRKFLEPPQEMTKEDKKALDNMRAELEIKVEGGKVGNFPPIVSFQELEGFCQTTLWRLLARWE